MAALRSKWLRRLVVADGAPIVFAIPPVGAGPNVFRPWIEVAPPDLEIVAVKAPGREDRFSEEPFRTVTPLADRIAEELDRYGDRPCAIFGHSLGGLVGHQVAQRLGPSRVQLLVVAAAPPPGAGPVRTDLTDAEITRLLREWGGTPADILADPELASVFTPCVRADLEVFASCQIPFSAAACVDVPMLAMAGDDDPFAPPAMCAGWEPWTRREFGLQVLSGGHFFPITAARQVLNVVASRITRALVGEG